MNREETIALFEENQKRPGAWNKWAQGVIEKKQNLIQDGVWRTHQVKTIFPITTHEVHKTSSENPSVSICLDDLFVDFSCVSFIGMRGNVYIEQAGRKASVELDDDNYLIEVDNSQLNFDNLIFPGDVDFYGAKFCLPIHLEHRKFSGILNLESARFYSFANFIGTKFKRTVRLNSSKFYREAIFSSCQFKKNMHCSDTHFIGDLHFNKASTKKSIEFKSSTFYGGAFFIDCKFEGNLDFSEALFSAETEFTQSQLSGFTVLDNAKFKSSSYFVGLNVEKHFSLKGVRFCNQTPDFTQAHFNEAPRLDNAIVIIPPKFRGLTSYFFGVFRANNSKYKITRRTLHRSLIAQQYLSDLKQYWKKEFFNLRRDEDEEARYRSLKRLAIQAHDHVNELEFSAGEVRARRYIRDFPWPWQNGLSSSFRYWTGALYDLSSDFGRSLWRPAFLWAAVFCLFSSLYLSNATELAGETCKNSNDMTPSYAANTIAAKNSLLFLGMDRTDKLKRAYACLYGASPLYAKASETLSDPRQKTGYDKLPNTQKHLAPNVPPLVSFLGILHSVLSLSLIFLLLLAIRNQFKIK